MQAPQRMQRRVAATSWSAKIRERPLSRITRWTSPGPSFSPGPRGPLMRFRYVDTGWPVAERVRTVRIGATSSSFSTTFSIPMRAMWTGGTCVDIRPFPSFSTRTSVPVSATAMFTPDTPASASKNFRRSTRRAVAVRASTSSVYSAPRIFSPKSRAICCRLLWIAGMMMCEGVSPSSWMMYSPRSLSRLSTPFFSRKSFRCISSDTIDLPFTRRVAPRARRIPRTISFASSVVSAQWTRMPFAAQRVSSASRSSGSFASVRARIEAASERSASHSAGSGNWAARLAMRPSIARRKFALRLGSRSAFEDEAWKSAEPVSALTGPLPEELGEVHRPRRGAGLLQRAADVQEAGRIRREDDRGSALYDVGDLVRHHRGRDVRIAHGERPAEAAALALACQRRHAHVAELREEALRLRLEPHLPQAVAGGVPRHRLGAAPVRQAHAEDVHEKLRELDDAARERDRGGFVGLAREELRVVVPHHPRAGTRGHDDGKIAREERDLHARDGPRFRVVAAVERRLRAAGLAAREDDADALALQELDSRQPRLGEKEIHDAGPEEVDGLGLHGRVLPANEASRISTGCAMGSVAPRSPRSLLIWSVQPGLALARRSAFTERTFSAFLRPISSDDCGATRL